LIYLIWLFIFTNLFEKLCKCYYFWVHSKIPSSIAYLFSTFSFLFCCGWMHARTTATSGPSIGIESGLSCGWIPTELIGPVCKYAINR
jgi:drug/metabolite transporter superfamily protein YnfA